MKLSLPCATLVLVPFQLFPSAKAALDCNVQVSRSETAAVCAHFDAVSADPYYQWYDELDMKSRYTGMVYLQGSDASKPENGAAVHWKVDEEYLHLAMAVRATGWLGFGFGEGGGMVSADMALFEANKPDVIVDAYTTDQLVPVTDDCPSNWELVSFHSDGGFMMIEFKRLLDTNDPQDKPIFKDTSSLVSPHRVIAAWGDSDQYGYHGLNRARGAIRFYGAGDDASTFFTEMQEKAEGSFLVASINHEIPANETEYAFTCVNRKDMIDQGVVNTTDLVNIIGFEPIIQDGHEPYVHHYILSGYQTPECPEGNGMQEIVYFWGPGDGPVDLPDNLGTPLFGEDGFQSFQIEVHYNNPQLVEGIIDSSGVRVYWTSQPRDQQLGVLAVGDPLVGLYGQPVGDGLAMHSFDCSSSCSSAAGQNVTVLREYLHMHQTGARITNKQIRNGEVIREAVLDYWDFHNGNTAIQQDPFIIQPGDAFKTSCYYSGEGRIFGLASSEEMCIVFYYYYPRVKIQVEEMNLEMPWMCGYNLGYPPCDTIHDSKNLASTDELGRYFGVSAEDECDGVAGQAGVPSAEASSSSGSPVHIGLLLVMVFAVMF